MRAGDQSSSSPSNLPTDSVLIAGLAWEGSTSAAAMPRTWYSILLVDQLSNTFITRLSRPLEPKLKKIKHGYTCVTVAIRLCYVCLLVYNALFVLLTADLLSSNDALKANDIWGLENVSQLFYISFLINVTCAVIICDLAGGGKESLFHTNNISQKIKLPFS